MKFSIRELLLVTVIVAIQSAWWVDHRQQAGTIRKLKEQSLMVDYIWTDFPTSSSPGPQP
jgi:hypothetical protein